MWWLGSVLWKYSLSYARNFWNSIWNPMWLLMWLLGSFYEPFLKFNPVQLLCDDLAAFREHIPYPMGDIFFQSYVKTGVSFVNIFPILWETFFENLYEILWDYLCDNLGLFCEDIPYPMWAILEIQSYVITHVITGIRFVNIFPILWEIFFEILCGILCDYLCDNWGLFREHIIYPMRDIFFSILWDLLCDNWGLFLENIPYHMRDIFRNSMWNPMRLLIW